MSKVKKLFISVLSVLLIGAQSVAFASCGNETADSGSEKKTSVTEENGAPLGIYTDLQFVLNGENGTVTASVKNKFTLFPSTVTVKVELYKFHMYSENFDKMILMESKQVYDLEQGETLSVSAPTNGGKRYWKARVRYKIDNNVWQENISETVLLDENGSKMDLPAPIPADREYYISDFLKSGSQSMRVEISSNYIPEYVDFGYLIISYKISNEDLLEVKDTVGSVKLEMSKNDSVEAELFYYIAIGFNPDCSLNMNYGNGKTVRIIINDAVQDDLNANIFVRYYDDGVCQAIFKALLADDTKEKIIELAKNMYKS